MSISTYLELVAALDGATGYLHRTDLTAKIPDFVRLCESQLNRKLKLLLQELETPLTATIGSRFMPVPTRFGTPIKLWCTTYQPRLELTFREASDLPVNDLNNCTSQYYTVDGSNIATESAADVAYTYTLRYLTKFDLVTTGTNTVLTNHPDVYLYGTLLASVPYTGVSVSNADAVSTWQTLYVQAMKEANTESNATRSKQTLRTEFGGCRENIYRGF